MHYPSLLLSSYMCRRLQKLIKMGAKGGQLLIYMYFWESPWRKIGMPKANKHIIADLIHVCRSIYRKLRARRALLHISKMFHWGPEGRYRHRLCMYSNSALLVLNGTSLTFNNALLALNWQYLCVWLHGSFENMEIFLQRNVQCPLHYCFSISSMQAHHCWRLRVNR